MKNNSNSDKQSTHKTNPLRLILLGVFGLGITMMMLLYGMNISVLNPKGYIANEQLRLLIFSSVLLFTIGLPTVFLFYFFAWRYRETNTKVSRKEGVANRKKFAVTAWAIPALFALVLSIVMWPATHRLEPKDPIVSSFKPLTVQVIALPWKWLFIYPDQRIATVNYVRIPVGTPVKFELTADEVSMSSFWVPNLGGQLYAMTGHVNTLNLIADEAGQFSGSTAEVNGDGFAGMRFIVDASSRDDFNRWVEGAQSSQESLDDSLYASLLAPSENQPRASYSLGALDLYDTVIAKYSSEHKGGHDIEGVEPHTDHSGLERSSPDNHGERI